MLRARARRLQFYQSLALPAVRFRQLCSPNSASTNTAVRASRCVLSSTAHSAATPLCAGPIVTTFSHRSSSEERCPVIQILKTWDFPVAYRPVSATALLAAAYSRDGDNGKHRCCPACPDTADNLRRRTWIKKSVVRARACRSGHGTTLVTNSRRTAAPVSAATIGALPATGTAST